MENWVQQHGFRPAQPDIAALFKPESGTAVWTLQVTGVHMAVVFQRDGGQCRVYTRDADLAVVREAFAAIVEGIGRPGIRVEREVEEDNTAGGGVRQLGFRVRMENRTSYHVDYGLLLTVNPRANALFPVIMSASRVAPASP